jgi:hypothetical protein
MPTQKWEYAYINTRLCELVYLTAGGKKKLSGNWAQCETWITQLGQAGYEMVGVTSHFKQYGETTIYEYWFKRPLP